MASLIEMSGISKAYDSTIALDDVSLDIDRGTIHALVGENGAGKSTLMKILAGVVQRDVGTVRVQGEEVDFHNPREALERGVSTVFQELSLLPNLTIAENMFLGKEPVTRFGRIDRRRMEDWTATTLGRFDLDLDPATIVSRLTIAQRQFVEIAHGMNADADVIVLDEPTAALNAADVEVLNQQIRSLAQQGKAIIYISHRLEEIFEICDTVSVLKDGKNVVTCPVGDVTPHSLIGLMVGRDIEDLFPPKASTIGGNALRIDDLRVVDGVDPVSINIGRHEIVALAGLEGQGQHEIVRSLVGQHQPVSGTATVGDTSLKLPLSTATGVRTMQSLGVGFVPEDRKDEGLFLELSIGFNLALGLYSRRNEMAHARRYTDVIAETMDTMDVKATGPKAKVSSLSGGNQQKVLLGRSFAARVDVLVVEEPTRGVDVGAKSEIYRLLRQFAEDGGAVLILSRETPELIGLCDRLYVIHRDAVVAEFPALEATEHKILDAALNV